MMNMKLVQRLKDVVHALTNNWEAIALDRTVEDVMEGRAAKVDDADGIGRHVSIHDYLRALPVIAERYGQKEAERVVWDTLYWNAPLEDQMFICKGVGFYSLARQLEAADGNTARASELYCRAHRPDLLNAILAQNHGVRSAEVARSGVREIVPAAPPGYHTSSLAN